MKITVWTLPNCVQCQQTKKQFDLMGIRYVEESLDSNPFKLDEFRAKGLLTAPIVETDTKVWAGFRLDKIRSLAGYLKSKGDTQPVVMVEGLTQDRYLYHLENAKLAGRDEERERIIKLLGQTKSPSHLWGGIGWAIALIKGEN